MVLSREQQEREALRQYAAEALRGLYTGAPIASPFVGGRAAGLRRLQAFDVRRYNATHNHVPDGETSRLSPYIRHGLLSLREVRDSVVERFGAATSRGFVMQLLWRVFWHLLYRERSMASAVDGALAAAESEEAAVAESGSSASEAAAPGGRAARFGTYGLYCIDESLRCLRETGFLSYQSRLWIASYLLHWQRVDWREGFRYFQEHLVDADSVVNALSWRWVLGEISGRPYFFNRARVEQCTDGEYCARCTVYRCPFEGSLAAVEERARRPGAMIR